MILKNSYNFNKITKSKKFVGLLVASKKAFSPNPLESPSPLNLKTTFFNTKFKPSGIHFSFGREQPSIKTQIANPSGGFVKGLVTTNWSCFVYAKRMINYKKIQTRFRSIISDQKKRAAFDSNELTRTLLKSLLYVDCKAALEPLYNLSTALKNGCFSKSETLNRPYIGSGLLLEQAIYRQFTKKRGITQLRNRCILTGRASIVGKFRLSRISFRRYAGKGMIPGMIKRSN